MSQETDAPEPADDDPSSVPDRDERRRFDRELLSDLSVNVVPIVIIAVFTLGFLVFWPAGEATDPVLLFHAVLVVGVVLVSVVAGWTIGRKDSPLEGSAARSYDGESERD